LKGKGEVKGAYEESVVGEIGGEGFEGEGVKGVGLGHRGGREERREEQRAKIVGWTNGSRVLEIFKIFGRRANGKRRMVWELRSEGGRRRGRGRKSLIGWREIGGRWKWRSLGKRRRNHERRKMIGEGREWEVKVGDRGKEI
jgi:hypothetical protein